jgi:membrane associated rhomboid family serine protease
MAQTESHKKESYRMMSALAVPVFLLLVMWVIYILMRYFGFEEWLQYGIIPRNQDGLTGIITWPLLHSVSDEGHIINNSLPTLVLGWSLFYFYPRQSYKVLTLIWLISGLCVWISARDAVHIGMSGVIYGLAAFLFTSGILNRNIRLLGVSLIVAFLYGSMIWGIFPIEERISWEGHLWGAVTGAVFAWVYRNKGPKQPRYSWEFEDDDDDDDLVNPEDKNLSSI